MFTMRYAPEDRVWQVGHYDPLGGFICCYEFCNQMEAARILNYLHGGSGVPFEQDEAVDPPI